MTIGVIAAKETRVMRKMGVAMTAALLLSACGGGGGEQAANEAVANAVITNTADTIDVQAKVLALPPVARDGVFLRAVRDAGFNCQEVTQTERREPVKGDPTWRIYCGKTPHLITLTKDGTAKITSRTDAN